MKRPFETGVVGGRVWKDSIVAECIGTIDEANAFIGFARTFSRKEDVKSVLSDVQRLMFRIGSEIAGARNLGEEDLNWILSRIEEFERSVEKPKKFVILEKDPCTASLSVARAVVRRAERRAVELYRNGLASELLVECLNKLSYLLYLAILAEGGEFEEVVF